LERIEISNRVQKILKNILKHNSFEMRDDLMATDVDGWDSLSHMIIITEIEKDYGIKFKLKELNKLKNIGSLIELVETKL
jgi:acyl carrier protein